MKWIASRKLRYADKGTSRFNNLTIRVSEPYLLKVGDVDFQFTKGTAGCSVVFEGLDETSFGDTYGADPIQALELAIAGIEPNLRRLGKKYDFSFPTGEPYFDDETKD